MIEPLIAFGLFIGFFAFIAIDMVKYPPGYHQEMKKQRKKRMK